MPPWLAAQALVSHISVSVYVVRDTAQKPFYDEESLCGRVKIQANAPSSGKLTLVDGIGIILSVRQA